MKPQSRRRFLPLGSLGRDLHGLLFVGHGCLVVYRVGVRVNRSLGRNLPTTPRKGTSSSASGGRKQGATEPIMEDMPCAAS